MSMEMAFTARERTGIVADVNELKVKLNNI